jgi:formylglycine-generating enzyme required for sulfatase activity
LRALDARGAEVAAEVSVCAIDDLACRVGAPRALGAAPLASVALTPGRYRFRVEFESGGTRELIRSVSAGEEVQVTAVRRDDEDEITRGMVLIERCTYTFPELQGEQSFSGTTVELDAFWIDATEVSNRAYREFQLRSGRPLPAGWALEDDLEAFLARYGDHAVTGIAWEDAVAYAESLGKRLPTAAEWHRFAGGPENRPVPWLAEPGAEPRGNVGAPESTGWDGYLEHSAPVTSHPEACTPEGIHHAFGNVFELTETVAATLGGDGTFELRPHDRWVYGAAWDAVATRCGMRTPLYQGTGPNDRAFFIGFRCAKSASP